MLPLLLAGGEVPKSPEGGLFQRHNTSQASIGAREVTLPTKW